MPPSSRQPAGPGSARRGPAAPGLAGQNFSGPSFAGAVDLSSLARKPDPPAAAPAATPAGGAQQASAPAGPAASNATGAAAPGVPAVVDVTDATFMTEVIERSRTVPVVIDFWAEWCGPCRQLSPVLESLAAQSGGAWVLAKMDVDANPAVSGQLQVQSIPMVMVAVGGQLMQGFTGALPEPQVREFIAAVLQAAAGAGIGEGPPPPPVDPRMVEAEAALQRGDIAAAKAAFTEQLRQAPADAQARSGLSLASMLERVTGVNPAVALADAANRRDDVDAQLLAADVLVSQGEMEQGLKALVDTVRRTFGPDRDRVRERFVELADLMPPDDPVVVAARRALANALF